MKKVLSLVLALIMCLSLVSFASAEGYSGEIKIWVAEAAVEFTKAQVEVFKAQNPEYANMTVLVQPVGEGDAAGNMITDVEAGADIFGFAQDQLARLVAAGALEEVAPPTGPAWAGTWCSGTRNGSVRLWPWCRDRTAWKKAPCPTGRC